MIVLREANYVTVPWKNGGGLTREILKVPENAAAFYWRLSLATIEAPGPFSVFDGYARTLLLVRGAGVQLDFGPQGQTTLRAPGQAAAFDGAWSTYCTLVDGPSSDLNLMVSTTLARAETRILRLTAPELIRTSGWEETVICCICGSLQVENAAGEIAALAAVDVVRCTPDDGVVTCAPEGTDPTLVFVASLRREPPR